MLRAIKRLGFDFNRAKMVSRIFKQLPDRERVARVERERDHRFNLRKLDFNQPIIKAALSGSKRTIRVRTTMKREIIADAAVRRPDRRQASRFRCHHVDPIPEIDRERRNSRSGELENAVLDEPLRKNRLDQRQRDVLRPDAMPRCAR